MKSTYVWCNNDTVESFLDGIIADLGDQHIYNCGPEWEIGNCLYSDWPTFYYKLSQVEKLLPEIKNNLIFLRGCHSEVFDDLGICLRKAQPFQDLNIRVENIFGQSDYMWNYLLWMALGTQQDHARYFVNDTRFSVSEMMSHQPKKLFCCLQNRPHAHRISALLALCDLGLDTRGDCTFANSINARQDFERWCLGSESDILRSASERLVSQAQQIDQANHNVGEILEGEASWAVPDNYPEYLFDIVVESTLQTNFFTEKTFKAIYWGKPFVILGSKSQNTILTDLGYETFPEYFDLSGDSDLNFQTGKKFMPEVTDHYKNILRPFTEVSESDIPEIFTRVRPRVQHNHSVMVKGIFDDELIPEYLQIPRHEQHTDIRMSREYINNVRSWFRSDQYFKQYV